MQRSSRLQLPGRVFPTVRKRGEGEPKSKRIPVSAGKKGRTSSGPKSAVLNDDGKKAKTLPMEKERGENMSARGEKNVGL